MAGRLVLSRRAGQQIRVQDRASGRYLWIEVYQRSRQPLALDFCFRDPDNAFAIDREERVDPSECER